MTLTARDADNVRGADDARESEAVTDRTAMEATETTDADAREQAIQHLETALGSTDNAEKQFHVREALQLLSIDN